MKRKRNIQIDTVNARNPKLTIPIDAWHEVIDEPTFANAILDRLVHNASAQAEAAQRQRIFLHLPRSGQVARRPGHGSRSRRPEPSPDPRQDRALAPDHEEPRLARKLLSVGRARAWESRLSTEPKQRESAADVSVEFVKRGSEEAEDINRVLLKEVERARHTAHQVVALMNDSGYPGFGIGDHTRLWQSLDARRAGTPFGRQGDYRSSWVWFETWIVRVRAHCEEQGERYR